MKRRIALWKALGGFILIGLGLVGCVAIQTIKANSMAPDFSLTTLAGEQIVMNKLRGRPLVLGFEATWCKPCQEELLVLKRLHEQYPELVVLVVGMGYGRGKEDIKNTWRAQADKFGLAFKIALDYDRIVYDAYEVSLIPSLFFIDKAGVIQARHLGLISSAQVDQALTAIGIKP